MRPGATAGPPATVNAPQASGAMEALRARERQQAAVADLGQLALASTDLSALLDAAVEKVADTLGVELAKVLELPPGGDALLLRAGVGWKEGYVGHATVPAGSGSQAGYALLSCRPVIAEDLPSETRFQVPPLLRDHGAVSGVTVTITGGERPFGVLSAHSTTHRTFDLDDVHFLQAVANVIALAIARARTEKELREVTSELQGICRALPDLYFRLDRGGTVLDYKAGRPADLYVPPERFLGRRMQDVLPVELGRRLEEALAQVLETGEVVTLEYSLPMPVGPQAYEARLVALPNEQMMAIVRNITDRKRAEDGQRFLAEAGRILASSLDYQATLRSVVRLAVPTLADWAVVELVDDRTIHQAAVAHVDPAMEGLAREVGRRYPLAPERPLVAQVLQDKQPFVISEVSDRHLAQLARNPEHLEMLRSLGIASAMAVPLVARGRILGAIVFVQSESGRRYTAGDLPLAGQLGARAALAVDNARLYHEAQEAIRTRDDFLSAAAHELKTPVAKLRGYAQLEMRRLDRGALDPGRIRHALDVIDRQSQDLSRLIGQILDVLLIDAGRLELRRQTTDVPSLVRETVAQAQASTSQHTLSLHAPESLQAWVDPQRLEQVLSALLDNAIKFSWQGGEIEVDLSTPTPTDLRLSVRDHGIGIPPEQRAQLFERFFRAHPPSQFAGLGLGLYISRHIVQLHGGHIQVGFPPDDGSCFTITLPIRPPEDS